MPNLGIKTNLEKVYKNREKLDELEADYKRRKTRLDINVRYLESDEKKYAERKLNTQQERDNISKIAFLSAVIMLRQVSYPREMLISYFLFPRK